MNETIYNQLNPKVTKSEEWDALYDNLPLVIVSKLIFLKKHLVNWIKLKDMDTLRF